MARIREVHAREVLDSRGWPTVEADVTLEDGALGRASVPSGASTGASEAVELRDGDRRRYRGRGVLRAVRNVNEPIAERVRGLEATDQAALDQAMIELDGTPNKGNLGANAILAVSLATARAAAASAGVPLWRYLNESLFQCCEPVLPLPMINILSGGHHAGFQIDIQDVLVIPVGARDTGEALAWTNAVYYSVRDILRHEIGYTQLVADEGGFGPRLQSDEHALRIVTEGILAANLRPHRDVAVAVDVAATHFCVEQQYKLAAEDSAFDSGQMVELLRSWTETYPVISLEDGLADTDWDGWKLLKRELGDTVQLIGDDLFTTNVERLKRGIEGDCANSILIKVNQIGTLSEAAQAFLMAHEAGYTTVISARSGETEDSLLADLAVASGSGQIKIGSIARSERLAKYNQLLRIEEELGTERFTGAEQLARWRRGDAD